MQRWCEWQVEPLFRLVMGICLILGGSGLAVAFVLKFVGSGSGPDFAAMVLHTLIFHGGVMILVALFLREQGLSWRVGFGIRFDRLRALWWPVILATVVCLVAAQGLGWLSGRLIEAATGEEPVVQSAVTLLRETRSPFRILYMAVMTVFLAPLAEELVFRGVLFTAIFQFQGRWVAVVSSSVLFGLIHANGLTLLPLTVMAVILTLLYERTRNLMAPILTHALFNLTNFLMLMWEVYQK